MMMERRIDDVRSGQGLEWEDQQASTIAALKEQLAGARNAALIEAAGVCEMWSTTPGNMLAVELRALASQPAAPVADRNSILDEAIAAVPGGSICDPQQVADAIRRLKGKPAALVQSEPLTTAQALYLRNLTLDYIAMHFDSKRMVNAAYVIEYLNELKEAPIDISVLGNAPAAPPDKLERAFAEENRQLMAKANEWRAKFNESEESRHELLRLLNEEASGTAFMGEPVLPHRPDVSGMVNRFLGWRLPDTFAPDCGISFDGRKDDEWNKNKSWPIGTNLLNAAEAKAMFEYCLAAPPVQQPDDVRYALQYIHDTFKRDLDAGYSTKDKIFAVEIAQQALTTTRPSAALTENQLIVALRKAFNFGQTYWQQADSEYVSQHKKTEETVRKYEQHIKDTCAILAASGAAEQVVPDDEYAGKFAYTEEGGESFTGIFDSEADARAEADAELDPGSAYTVAECVHPMEKIRQRAMRIGTDIAERLDEMAFDEIGGDDPAIDLNNEDAEKLGNLVLDFAKREGSVNRWGVKNERQYVTPAAPATQSHQGEGSGE